MDAKDKAIGPWLSVLYRTGQSYLDKELKAYNLGSGQGMFLAVLLHQDGISQENLSALLQIDKGTTARAIKKLEKEGYIIRRADPNDRRANIIRVTEKSLTIKPVLKRVVENWTDMLTKDFSKEEKEQVVRLLKRMAVNTDYCVGEIKQ
ncbi:MAG: hypothetical protein VR72_10080 [Clostridiaceae bacterium BRH_c20a]|nr:MAG: hypothetical protein VR72_10080 [Clostridiaceae bacterium BRH_c20a]